MTTFRGFAQKRPEYQSVEKENQASRHKRNTSYFSAENRLPGLKGDLKVKNSLNKIDRQKFLRNLVH